MSWLLKVIHMRVTFNNMKILDDFAKSYHRAHGRTFYDSIKN